MRGKPKRNASISVLTLLVVVCAAGAGDWPHWRGPYFNGSSDEVNLPTAWTTTDNVAWRVDLPGPSAATPIVWGEHVFVPSVNLAEDTLLAMCLDRIDGRVRWRHTVAQGTRRDRRSYFAAPSPVTDGKVVVFFYSNGELLAFDFEGRRLWRRNIQEDYGPFAFLWTFSSSPMLFKGTLYLQVLQRDVPVDGRGLAGQENLSYLLAMDPQTGKTLWRHIRPSPAVAESREGFSTPIPARFGDADQLLLAGGDVLTGHDPESGRELWRWGTWNPRRIGHWRLVPSPVVGDGVVLVCAPKNDPVYAIRPDRAAAGGPDVVAWDSRDTREITSDVPTPAFHEGDFFVLSDLRRCLSRVEAATGRIRWTVSTPDAAKYEASPTVADGKVYLINHRGDAAAINADDGKVLHQIRMDEPTGGDVVRASISVAHGHLFIRTTRRLTCVGPTMSR